MMKRFSHLFGPLGRGALLAFALNIVGLGLLFALQILLARSLGENEYGIFQFAMAWLQILLIPALLGSELLLIKYIPRSSAVGHLAFETIRISLRWVICASFLISILLVLAASSQNFTILTSIAIGSSFFLFALNRYSSAFFSAQKQVFLSRAPLGVIRPLIMIIASAVLISFESLSLSTVFILLALTYGLSLSISFIDPQARRVFRRFLCAKHKVSAWRRRSRVLLKFGAQLSIISSVYLIMSEMDKVLLGLMKPTYQLAWYSAAAQYALFVYFGFNAINVIAGPTIAEYYQRQDRLALQSVLRRIALLNLLFALPALSIIFGFPNLLLNLFGENYVAALPALLILSSSFAIDVLNGPTGYFLSVSGEQKTGLKILLIGLGVNLVLTPPLILEYGLTGAAIGTALAIMVRSFLAKRFVRKTFEVKTSLW